MGHTVGVSRVGRLPLDWAYPAAFTLVALDVAGAPRQRLSYSTRAT